MLGKKEEPGRPLLYGSSKEFLEFCAAKFPQIEKRLAVELKLPEVNKAPSDAELNKAIGEFNAVFVKTPNAKV